MGDVTPKWRPRGGSRASRLVALLTSPVRSLYNSFLVEATDEFIWEHVARHLQGNDIAGVQLRAVTRSPCVGFKGWPQLPPDVDRDIVDIANRNARVTLAAVRSALGLSATAGPGSPSVITGIASQVTLRELVHTSYCVCPAISELIAIHTLSHATARPGGIEAARVDPSLTGWYADARQEASAMGPHATLSLSIWSPRRVLPLVQGVGLACLTVLAWIGLSGVYRSSVEVLTDEYQIDVIRSRAPEVIPSVYWKSGLPWVQALAAFGQLTQASHDLARMHFQFPGDESQALSTLGATLRALRRPLDAINVEEQALTQASAIAESQQQTYAIATLAEELASYGVAREELLNPATLSFGRVDELVQISGSAARSGYPDLATKILFWDSGLSASFQRLGDDAGVGAIVSALLTSGRKSDALDLAAADDVFFERLGEKTPSAGLPILEAYARNGRWRQAEDLARRMNADAASARFAWLLIESGQVSSALENVRKVREWQYVSSDGAHIAAALATASQTAEASQLARRVIQEILIDDNPWWDVEQLIRNQGDLRKAGAVPELESAESVLLDECARKYGKRFGGVNGGDVLERAVDDLIGIGDPGRAYSYVRGLPDHQDRAELLPLISMAFAGAGRPDLAREALQAAMEELSKVPGEGGRSLSYARIARAQAGLHKFRLARLAAEQCNSLEDRLTAYADILLQYSIALNTTLKPLVADPRGSPRTRP
jgi:tetratricopeptide (TPR) repeat protein